MTGRFDLLPLIYSLIVLTWVSGFDIIYALQDDDFDKSNQLYSIPSATGRKRALVISVVVHFVTFILVVVAGFMEAGAPFLDRSSNIYYLINLSAPDCQT